MFVVESLSQAGIPGEAQVESRRQRFTGGNPYAGQEWAEAEADPNTSQLRPQLVPQGAGLRAGRDRRAVPN